jgi:hypothetical protein
VTVRSIAPSVSPPQLAPVWVSASARLLGAATAAIVWLDRTSVNV